MTEVIECGELLYGRSVRDALSYYKGKSIIQPTAFTEKNLYVGEKKIRWPYNFLLEEEING